MGRALLVASDKGGVGSLHWFVLFFVLVLPEFSSQEPLYHLSCVTLALLCKADDVKRSYYIH